MKDRFSSRTTSIAKWTERILSLFILVCIIIFTFFSAIVLFQMDWSQPEAFYEMINRILLIVIGIELMRTLITHDLHVIIELLAIVIARKLLIPDLDNLDIVLSVASFATLLAARKFLLDPEKKDET